jgi:hypothetical protein
MGRRGQDGYRTHRDMVGPFLGSAVAVLIALGALAYPAMADEAAGGAEKAPQSKVLSVPYAFYNSNFGAAVGYVYGQAGFPQPQSTVIATAIAGSNRAAAFFFLTRDIRVPSTQQFYIDTDLALSTYGTVQTYIDGNPDYADEHAGSNSSSRNNYVEGDGTDNLVRVNLRYLLPIGGGKDGLRHPKLAGGLPVEGTGEGPSWNPLESGKTFIEMKPFWREQSVDGDEGEIDQKTNGSQFSLYRDNTDFWKNPSQGSTTRLRWTEDWGWSNSSNPYYVGDFEYSQYIPLSHSDTYRNRVLALDFWTSNAFSWDRTTTEDGQDVFMRPPSYHGSTLGGLWRMRGYPAARFHDQAAIYYSVEYRVIPEWNPFTKIDWLQRNLGVEWWQIVTFVEAGRVAPVWTVSELNSSLKWDGGVGIRAMAKGIVARIDLAGSEEGLCVNMMVGQPFQF